MYAAKTAKYLGRDVSVLFAVFALSFFVSRIVALPAIVVSAWYITPFTTPPSVSNINKDTDC
jgi:hypothetical protein